MNPLEFLIAQFAGGGDPEMPGLAPGAPAPMRGASRVPGVAEAAAARGVEPPQGEGIFQSGGDNSPAMLLRRLLTGSSESPNLLPGPADPMGDPEGGRMAADITSQLKAPSSAPPPSNVSLGSMPSPVGNQADAMSMFSQGQQQPSAGRMPVPSRAPMPAFETKATPAAAPAAKPAGGDFDWGKFLLQTLQGGMAGAAMAHGTPRDNGIGTFGAGFTTAQKNADARQVQENTAKKLAFDQSLALAKNTREERGANRDDEKLGLSKEDQKRKAEEGKAKNELAVKKYMDARVLNDGNLSTEGQLNLYKTLTQRLAHVNKNGMMSEEAINKWLATEEQTLTQKMGVKNPAGAASVDPNEGKTAFNPQTGQRLVRKGGQWVPAP